MCNGVVRQVSRKVELLSTSTTALNGHSGEKTRVSLCNTTLWNLFRSTVAHKFQLKISTCNGGFNYQLKNFDYRMEEAHCPDSTCIVLSSLKRLKQLLQQVLIIIYCCFAFCYRHSVRRKWMSEKTGLAVQWKIANGGGSRASQRWVESANTTNYY